MGLGAVVGAVGAIGSAVIGSSAASSAADAASQAAASNNALQQQIYNQNTANETPFMTRGNAAGATINGALGLGDSTAATNALNTFKNSSGYNFALDQGLQSVNNNYATRGALNSGASMIAINDRAQNIATQNAFMPWLSGLQTQQGTGLSAANALAGVGTNYANAVSSNNNNAASAAGNAAIASGNAMASGINGVAGALGNIAAGSSSSYGGSSNPNYWGQSGTGTWA